MEIRHKGIIPFRCLSFKEVIDLTGLLCPDYNILGGKKNMSLTYKEIKDQYQRLSKTNQYLDERMNEIVTAIDAHDCVIYMGCGSSYSLAKSYAATTMTQINKKSMAIPAGDVLLRPAAYKILFENSLIVAISRSGATSEILMALKELKKEQVQFDLISISCTTQSPLSEMSHLALELPWTFDESVCQTSAITNMYYTGQYILAHCAKNEKMISALRNMLSDGDAFLERYENKCKEIADLPWDFGVTLADSDISGVCEEGSLTFKEICQLPSNHYPVLDVRHGPIVVFNEKTLILVAVSNVDSPLERNLILDLMKKNAKVITISDVPLPIEGTWNFHLGKPTHYCVLGMLLLNAAQMITYYKAMVLKVNPDEPTGLDAWINLEK
jgi:fructoselysine-6-P-deglycase FrlB-like protein